MKRLFAVTATLCFLAAALYAGGTTEAAAKTATEEVTWMVHMDLATNKSWTTTAVPELLKKYGFDVKFRMIEMGTHDQAGEYYTKFQTTVASGAQPPDIIHLSGLRTEALDAGWYAELNIDTVKKLMPKYYAAANKIYDKIWAWGKDAQTGKLYGLPSWNMFGSTRHTMVYRKDWLDQLGLKVPVTIEEFETFLRKVRTVDFNGNGQKDEYGYTSGTNSPQAGFSEVFGAYGTLPQAWLVRDGKVVRGEMLPGAKEALATLARWYAEDLIPKGVNTTEKRRDGFNQGIRGSYGQADGYAPALVKGGQNYEEFYKMQPKGVMLPAPSFKGPRGEWGTLEWGPRKYTASFGSHLAKNPAKMEMLMKMLETIATNEELFVAAMLGKKGVHWDFTDPSKTSGATKFLEPYTEFNKRLDEVGVREMSESPYCPVWVPEVYEKYLDPLAVEYAHYNPGYFDALLQIPFAAQTKYSPALNNLTNETFLSIVTGRKPLGEYDSYVQTWMKNGGEEMTKAAQALYDKAFK